MRKKVLYSSIVGVAVLGLLELSARVIEIWVPPLKVDYGLGFDAASRLFQVDPFDPAVRQTVPDKLSNFRSQRFVAKKPPKTFRIAVVGGSSVYQLEDELTELKRQLTKKTGGRFDRMEFINAGGRAYGSHRLIPILLELFEFDLDMVLVYSGHNEFEEVEQLELANLELLDLSRGLAHSALVRFIRDRYAHAKIRQLRSDHNRRVLDSDNSPFGANYVRASQHRWTQEEVEDRMQQFHKNLQIMVQQCRARDIPVAIGTVPSNLVKPAIRKDVSDDVRQKYQSAIENYVRGNFSKAEAMVRKILRNALGRNQSSDRENEIIRQLAFEHNVALADVEKAVIDREPHGVPGMSLFGDHCHLNADGRRVWRETFVPVVIGLIPEKKSGSSTSQDHVTFNRDVAPILFQHCSDCHRAGEAGPFHLLTYQDAKKRAEQIVYVIDQRIMPPWLPDDACEDFVGDRRLSEHQKSTIKRWVAEGSKEGSSADLPELPTWTEGWQQGQPDLIIQLPEPYDLPAESEDGNVFHTYVIPIPVSSTQYVKAVEVRPTNRRVVHHALFYIDRDQSLRAKDAAHAGPGFPGSDLGKARWPGGHWPGYLPGRRTYHARDDIAWRLEPGTDAIIHLHMTPNGKRETVQLKIGFYWAAGPPEREAVALPLSRNDTIDIPAGEENYVVRDDFVLPVDVEALAVQPHAHYLGKMVKGTALLPDDTEKLLIQINNWDFNWQDGFVYATPVFLPKGTKVTMRFAFDNSSGNVRNPNNPPKRVRSGWNSTDEMAELWIQLLPKKHADLVLLKQQVKEEPLRDQLQFDIARLEQVLQKNPNDDATRRSLADGCNVMGVSRARAGLFQEAIRQFEKAIRIQPDLLAAYMNLGTALMKLGRLEDAAAQYSNALRIKPESVVCRRNLADVLRKLGRPEQAATHLKEAQRIEQENSQD